MNRVQQFSMGFNVLKNPPLFPASRLLGAILGSLSVHPVAANHLIESYVVNAAGGQSSNASFTNISCVGQGTPLGITTNVDSYIQSGFLTTFVLNPLLDYDGDGIPDELDLDDDGDGLADYLELDGVGTPAIVTNPGNDDTDADGVSDDNEVLAGTNPNDPASLLRLEVSMNLAGEALIEWDGRAGNTYVLLRSDHPQGLVDSPTFLGLFVPAGGVAPWFSVTSVFVDPSAVANQQYFYQIRLQNP